VRNFQANSIQIESNQIQFKHHRLLRFTKRDAS
jgi:hypothetical protein